MSKIVDTKFGRFRAVSDKDETDWLWECPKCGAWGAMSDEQMNGKVSVICSGVGGKGGCDYHETHEFGKMLVATMSALTLMGYRPYHDEGEGRFANPIPGGVDGPID